MGRLVCRVQGARAQQMSGSFSWLSSNWEDGCGVSRQGPHQNKNLLHGFTEMATEAGSVGKRRAGKMRENQMWPESQRPGLGQSEQVGTQKPACPAGQRGKAGQRQALLGTQEVMGLQATSAVIPSSSEFSCPQGAWTSSADELGMHVGTRCSRL